MASDTTLASEERRKYVYHRHHIPNLSETFRWHNIPNDKTQRRLSSFIAISQFRPSYRWLTTSVSTQLRIIGRYRIKSDHNSSAFYVCRNTATLKPGRRHWCGIFCLSTDRQVNEPAVRNKWIKGNKLSYLWSAQICYSLSSNFKCTYTVSKVGGLKVRHIKRSVG